MSGPLTTSDTPIDDGQEHPEPPCVERHESRVVDLEGIAVRRALPKRRRRTVGAWCFVDHFGPTTDRTMAVGPHPHIGLQTVTWLVDGEVLHLDSLGSDQVIRPGQLNLMTAGRGISHAEETPPGTTGPQHGLQLWVAQPEATRHGAPAFEHHAELPQLDDGGWVATVVMGSLAGATSPARTDSPLVGAALSAAGAANTSLVVDPSFELALVVLDGTVHVGAEPVVPGELVYLGRGRDELALATDGAAEAFLLGGEPFEAELAMWWNFVGRDRAELREAATDWAAGDDRYGRVASRLDRIDAPAFL